MVKPTTSSHSDDPKYKGVRKRKWGKWVSEIRLPNSRERIWLGSYDSPEKAARAFDAAQFCLRGRGAKLNFPNCPPDIPGSRSLSRQEIQAAAARFANEAPPGPGRGGPAASAAAEVSAADVSGSIDWSFLDLIGSGSGDSDFGLYDHVNIGGEMYPAPPVAYVDDECGGYENENENENYSHHSFLWDF